MEKSDAIAVETGSGVVLVIGNGGGSTEMVKETTATTIAGGNEEKETIDIEKSRLNKKARKKKAKKLKKRMMSAPKVVDGGSSAADDGTAAAVRSDGGVQGCRIMVSNTKKPLLFYLNLAKRFIKQNNYVELSALGGAIPTVVTIAEILKKDGWATEKDITISSVPLKDDANGRVLMKAKIGILLEKTEKFDKNGLVVAKGASEICENETEEFSSETNGEVFEVINQHLSVTNGTSTEKNDSQNASMELIEGKELSSDDTNLSEKKYFNENMTDKENTEVVVPTAGIQTKVGCFIVV